MGLFDARCAVSGLSLLGVGRVVGIPLCETREGWEPSGPPVEGFPDRAGGVDAGTPVKPPCALVALPIHQAIVENTPGMVPWMTARGLALKPDAADGSQHREADIVRGVAQARRRFSDVAWMQEAIGVCVRQYELSTFQRLGSGAPPGDWITQSGSSWYGVAFSDLRYAFPSRERLLEFLTTELDTGLMFEGEDGFTPVRPFIIAASAGDFSEWEVGAHLRLSHGGQLVPFSAREEIGKFFYRIFEAEDVSLHVDVDALERLVPVLDGPSAAVGRDVYLPVPWGRTLEWALRHEAHASLVKFARVQ